MIEKDIIAYHSCRDGHGRSYGSCDQLPISVKVDSSNMIALDAEMSASGIKRNRLINLAIKWYLRALDDARHDVCVNSQLL